MIKIYGIKNCDKVRKAFNFLKLHNINFNFIDYRKNDISLEIKLWIKEIGINNLINTKSTTYRNLIDKNINQQIIIQNPTLIKRPILVTTNNIIIGFNKDKYLELQN